MQNKVLFVVFIVIAAFLAWMWIGSPKVGATALPKVDVCHCESNECETLNIAAPAAAAHLVQHDDDYLGVCQVPEEPTDVCENIDGIQEETPEGYINDQGYCYIPEEPKDYCDTLEGVQAEDEDCPRDEEQPSPTPTDEPKDEPKGDNAGDPDGPSTPTVPVCTDKVPGRVANINVVTTGNTGELEVQWSIPEAGNSAHIEYGLEQYAQHALLNTPNDGNEVIKNLVSGNHYWFRVAGVSGCSVGEWSTWYDPLVP